MAAEWRKPEKFITNKNSLSHLVSIDIGFSFKSKQFTKQGVKLLRGQNIEHGGIRWKDTKYFPEEKLMKLEKLFIKEGDIILAMDRSIISTGLKLARARKDDLPCVLVQRVTRFKQYKQYKQLSPDYLMLLLSDTNFQNYLHSNQTGSNIPHISGKQILAYKVNIPSNNEQKQIVKRVESLFKLADKVEQQYQTAKQRTDKLTQSILAKAFRGKLVPQDPNDEPANELLKLIKESRA